MVGLIAMEASFRVAALEEAWATHGKPSLFNTDPASQLAGTAFTDVLIANDVAISMDGKGSWWYRVFVGRLRLETANDRSFAQPTQDAQVMRYDEMRL